MNGFDAVRSAVSELIDQLIAKGPSRVDLELLAKRVDEYTRERGDSRRLGGT